MEWYIITMYLLLIVVSTAGGVFAYLNFQLQKKWYIESNKGKETTEEKIDRLLKTPMPQIKPKDGL